MMKTLERPEARIRKVRLVAWIVAPLLTFPLAYLVAVLRAPDAPMWLRLVVGIVTTPIAGGLFAHAFTAATADLLVARLGTDDERRKRLGARINRFTSMASRAAIAFECGDLAHALSLIEGLSVLEKNHGVALLVLRRKELAVGDPAVRDVAIDALLAWRGVGRFGAHSEIARYHAFVLASALTGRAPDDAPVVAAARRLRDDRDFEVRAYATWLSTDDGDADELLAGATLARAVAREPLAQSLEVRAARASSGERAPYRAA